MIRNKRIDLLQLARYRKFKALLDKGHSRSFDCTDRGCEVGGVRNQLPRVVAMVAWEVGDRLR